MDKFKEIRDKIGKDLVVKIQKANLEGWSDITFEWEFIIGIDRYIYRVADEFRKNPLSFQEGRYTIINYSKDQSGKIYPNIHFYMRYIIEYLGKAYDYDFIYVWDDEDKRLIVVWEYDRDHNRYRMNKEIAEIISRHMEEDISQSPNVKIV
jgi:hypothetical protein